MPHVNFGIQNIFAQGGSVFSKASCSLIPVGACGPNLTQEYQAAGFAVYVCKSEAPLLGRNKEIHMSQYTATKQRLGLGVALPFNPEQARWKRWPCRMRTNLPSGPLPPSLPGSHLSFQRLCSSQICLLFLLVPHDKLTLAKVLASYHFPLSLERSSSVKVFS